MREADDLLRASICDELVNKLEQGLLNVAFCGHFSAGKTSLINDLCGYELLPSSPIPTSANVVFIRDGVAEATVKHTGHRGYEHVAISDLEQYAANGEDIEQIDITYPINLLGDRLALLDTPGIDSTDEQHLASTESALHLADVVFYVMDYNHVQSEMNLDFIKRLQNMGKPLYLVVNQIDKHNELELSFASFRDVVLDALHVWHIDPVAVLFISVRYEHAPHNELNKLKGLFATLADRSVELQQMNVKHTVRQLIHDHVRSLAEQQLQQTGSETSYEALLQSHNEQQAKLDEAKQVVAETEREFKQAIRQLLDNANVTPALTRDLASDYLQACEPKFRASFLASAKKTEAERAARLSRWHADMNAQIKANITWHLQQLLRQHAERVLSENDEAREWYVERIAQLDIVVTEQWLAQQVHKGAVYNAEYTMTYTQHIAAEVKASFRREAYELTDELIAALDNKNVDEIKKQQAEIENIKILLDFFRYEQQLEEHIASLPDHVELPKAPTLSADSTSQNEHSLLETDTPHVPLSMSASQSAEHGDLSFDKDQAALRGALVQTAQTLREAAQVVDDLPTMKPIVTTMRERAERLDANQFTIALFGAFSAGKSSLANALLGERIMPVSPHPTTAAINIVRAPLAREQHGTAIVMMKTKEALAEEVIFALRQIGERCSSLEDGLKRINLLKREQMSSKGKPYYSFLQAVAQGWSEAEAQLGKQLHVDLEGFNVYAASEAHACFVAQIELLYDCSFTEAGFILVDTPGADSINSRHTDLAFNYIKNADVLLFVTYYNHAFSQADRLFLSQLGSVKDSFALDKMFFLINAADLASSEQELEQVKEHVETQLLAHGIREPRLYPISSKLALHGKERADRLTIERSGILRLEHDFMLFFKEELVQLAINSANNDISYVMRTLEQYKQAAEAEEQDYTQKIMAWQQAQAELTNEFRQLTFESERRALTQEISEQLHYVKQRINYRFAELYHLAFNPADLREDTPHMRQALKLAYDELVGMLAKYAQQEVLAVTLRIENMIKALVLSQYNAIDQAVKRRITGFESQALDVAKIKSPTLQAQFSGAEIDETMLHRQFKQPKHFFEGAGKEKLRERLESHLYDPIARYIEVQQNVIGNHYELHLITVLDELVSAQLNNIAQFLAGMMTMIENRANIANMKERIQTMQGLRAN